MNSGADIVDVKFKQKKKMSSTSVMRTGKTSNFGGRVMIQQEKNTHIQRLNSIYASPRKTLKVNRMEKKKNIYVSKKQGHQMMEHQRNIQHLFNFISRPKKMYDRYKDPNDFYAFPVYFLREHDQTRQKRTKQKNKIRRMKSENNLMGKESFEKSEFERKYGIDASSVKQHLPLLQDFTREEIEEYADSLTRLIFNYNLNSRERLAFLKECAIKAIPSHYPPNFGEVVEEIFSQIAESLSL